MLYLTLFILLAGPATTSPAAVPTGRFQLRFDQFHTVASKAETQKRFRWRDHPADVIPGDELFEVYVAADYVADGTFGVLVWISPSDNGFMCPEPWMDVLERHKLIWIGANNAPNGRHADHRIRLAVEAAMQIQDRYAINPDRVFVAGLSGGGKIASMCAVSYPDVFTGGLSICGVNFYRNVPTGIVKNQFYPQEYYPPTGKLVALTKQRSRHVLLAGTDDFNLKPTQQIHDLGYVQDKFRNVTLLVVPGMAHALPDAEWFEKAVAALEPPPTSSPASRPTTSPGHTTRRE